MTQDQHAASYHELTVDLDTYRSLEQIAVLLGVDVEEALARVVHDAAYVYNSEALK